MSKREFSKEGSTSRNSSTPLSVLPPAPSYGADEVTPCDTATADQLSAAHKRDQNRLLGVHEVAQLLQVPVSWVYGRMRRKSSEQLPAYRIGKYWRFREEEIMAWVQCHKRSPDAA